MRPVAHRRCSSAAVAAALATGMSPLGLGNDGLGSLRHPAQCCGISVLKPGLGRIPDATSVAGPKGGAIGAQLVNVNGPLARPDPPREPARQPHQVSIVQHRPALLAQQPQRAVADRGTGPAVPVSPYAARDGSSGDAVPATIWCRSIFIQASAGR